MNTNNNFMNKKKHILITAIIATITFILCPLIYSTPVFDYNLYAGKQKTGFEEQIKKDNLILDKNDTDVRIMTFNLLAHYTSWGGTPVNERADLFFALRDGYLPDILGVQEMCYDWYNEINKNKSSYKFVSPIKTAFPQKMTALLYNSDTMEVIDSGSVAFKNSANFKSRRIVWGVFKHKTTNELFTVVNTHLSFLTDSEEADNFFTQARQVNSLYSCIETLYSQYHYPVFVIGDFNTKRRVSYQKSVINTGSYGILNSLYTDAEDITENKYSGKNQSFNNTLNDHIFIKGDIRIKNISILSQDCFTSLSDHYPLLADIKL